jgi:nucleoside-diphosphate-sugar epimerase
MSTAVVLGSSSFLGSHLVGYLAGKGVSVTGTYLSSKPTDKTFRSERCNLHSKAELFSLGKFDTVINYASLIVGTHKTENNLDMTRKVVDYCNKTGARYIFISSSQVNFETNSDYKASKVESEKYVIANSQNYVIIRPAAPYGKRLPFKYSRKQPMHVLVDFIKKLPAVPVIGNGKYFRQPVHVDNLNELVFQCLQNPAVKNKIFDIGGPEQLTFDRIVDCIAERYNKRVLKVHLPIFIFLLAANVVKFIDKENTKSVTCNEKADNASWQKFFDIPLVPFERGCHDL